MGLLDSILGDLNGSEIGDFPTDRMISTAPPSGYKLQQIKQKAPVTDEETGKAAQADRDRTLAQARDAVARDPSKRAAIIGRLRQLGIAV